MDNINILASCIAEGKRILNDVLSILEDFTDIRFRQVVQELRKTSMTVVSIKTESSLCLASNLITCEFTFDLDETFERFNAEAERITY